MKFIATILISSVVLASSMVMSTFGIPNGVILKVDQLNSSSNSSKIVKQNELSNNTIKNATLSSIDNNKTKGSLIVKIVVNNNKEIGNKTSSDFTIIIHANDPSPTSFAGNSSGTKVKLGMGCMVFPKLNFQGMFLRFQSIVLGV